MTFGDMKMRVYHSPTDKMFYSEDQHRGCDFITIYRFMKIVNLLGNGVHPMRFTGFFDKNGKEMYERDIVTFKYKNPKDISAKMQPVHCYIVWNSEMGMWSLKWPDGYINKGPLNVTDWKSLKYEVVGNWYQHKNLLK